MTTLARAILAMAVALLPGSFRRRYESETDAELFALPTSRRLRYAASFAVGSPRLRWALLAALSPKGVAGRCYLGVHVERTIHPNPEEHWIVSRQCHRCGSTRDPRQYVTRSRPEGMGWIAAHGRT